MPISRRQREANSERGLGGVPGLPAPQGLHPLLADPGQGGRRLRARALPAPSRSRLRPEATLVRLRGRWHPPRSLW